MSNQQPEKVQPLKPDHKNSDSLLDSDRHLSTTFLNLHTGDLAMLHQLTFNNLSRFMLTASFCLTMGFASQLDRPVAHATDTNLHRSGLGMNGIAINGTSFNGTNLNGLSFNGANLNGVSLNGPGLGANGVDYQAAQVTPSRLTTAALNQKPIQKIRLEGSQLALKIKRSD
jgi:uncharacterized protein YjbI with pentapeptide repeats